MKKAIKNPCTHRIQGRNVRVTTLFRICLAAHASSGFAPIGDTKTGPSRANERVASDRTLPPCRHAGRRLYGFKSPGDVTVAPVVPTAGSTNRSQNELHGNIPMPRTGRHLSEGFLSATLSAQTHFSYQTALSNGCFGKIFLFDFTKTWLLYILRSGIANSTFAYYNKINL